MRHLALLALAGALFGCAAPQPVRPLNVSNADEARCRYEAMAAYAGARERTIGDMLDNGFNQARLRRACLEARSAANDEANPPPVIKAVFDPRTGKQAPDWCGDPRVTNPHLRAECPGG